DFEHTLSDRDGFSGVRVEAKPYSRTVHTRGLDPELAATLHDHAAAVSADYPDIRVIEGHDITELAVKQATKGDGLRLLARAEHPTAMAYFGDDVTDEDAFAALEQLSDPNAADPSLSAGLSVKVGRAPTRAQCRIADPAAVALLLERLSAARAEHLDRDRASAGSRDGRSPALAGDLGLAPRPRRRSGPPRVSGAAGAPRWRAARRP